MNAISVRARSVGELLDGAFRLYRQDLGLYVFTAIVASLPFALIMVLSLAAETSAAAALAVGLLFLVGLVAMIVVWGALIHMMNERLVGREPTLGPSVRRALGVGHRVVWAGFLSYLVLGGAMLVITVGTALVVGALSAVVGGVVGLVAGVAVAVALTLLVGVRAVAGTALFLPGIVVERLSGYGSLRRGLALTRKGAGRVTVVLVVASVLVFVPVFAVYFIMGTASLLTDPQAVSAGTISMGRIAVQQLIVLMLSGFTTPFVVASILLLYYDQRVRFEAFDLEAEANALAS